MTRPSEDGPSRRDLIIGGAAIAAAEGLRPGAAPAQPAPVEAADPSFDTLAELAASDLSARSTDAVLVKGAAAAGDMMPVLFTAVPAEPAHAGKRQSRDGQWWEYSGPFAEDLPFGGPAERLAYTEELLAEGRRVYAPVHHPAEGLRVSQFLSSSSPYADQADAIAGAIARLAQDARYSVLDLEGRTVTVSRTIDIDDDLASPFAKPLKIVNGTILPGENWPGPEAPLVRFFSGKGARISRWGIEGVKFKCLNRASGVLVDGPYINMRFRWLDIDDPVHFAIRTRTRGGAANDLRVEFCGVTSNSADPLASKRVLIALDLDTDNDGKIFGNRISKARTALRGAIGSFLISHNHFWQGSDVGLPRTDITPVIHVGARSTNVVSVNYIDNGYTLLEEGLGGEGGTRTMGYCQFTSNIFTLAEAHAGATYIAVKPAGPDRGLANMIVRDNQIRNIGRSAERIRQPFSVDRSEGGSIDPTTAMNVRIEGNYFWGKVQPQSSTVEKFIPINGQKRYPVKLAGQTPFGLHADLPTHLAVRSDTGDPGNCYYQRRDGTSGTLHVKNAVRGKAYLALTVNASGIFG